MANSGSPVSLAASTPARRPRGLFRQGLKVWHLYAFIAPSFLLLLAFEYYPAALAIFHAFTEWNGTGSWTWTGLDNFRQLSQDFAFVLSLRNMAILLAWQLFRAMTVPLIFAELIYNFPHQRAQYWFRFLLVIPLVIPAVVESLVWRFFLNPPPLGLINMILGSLGLKSLEHAWLGDPHLALFGLMFTGFPWVLPIAMLIYYAGLQGMPDSIIDASRIDGASTLRRIFSVDIPLISGQMKLIFILNIIGGIQDFAWILIITNGGPGYATLVPALYMYDTAFSSGEFGYGSAIGLVLFLIIFVLTVTNNRFIRTNAAVDG